jgi:hypothetical protein
MSARGGEGMEIKMRVENAKAERRRRKMEKKRWRKAQRAALAPPASRA